MLWLLFAADDPALNDKVNTLGQVGVGAIIIGALSLIGTIANSVVNMLSNRDKLKYDNKIVQLEAQHKECEDNHAETKQKVEVVTKGLEKCQEEHKVNRQQFQELKEEIDKKIDTTKDKLNKKIDTLTKTNAHLINPPPNPPKPLGDTDVHKPLS